MTTEKSGSPGVLLRRGSRTRALDIHIKLADYQNSWKRLGFTDEHVARPGSNRLIDTS